MLTDILKTLSDTELVAISQEITNPAVPNISIYKQLVAKENDGESIDVNDFTNLPNLVITELSIRLLESDKA